MGLTYADIELISADDLALSRRGYLDKTKIKSNDHNMFKTIQKFQSDFKWEDWTQ
jgi:hypothetical protein